MLSYAKVKKKKSSFQYLDMETFWEHNFIKKIKELNMIIYEEILKQQCIFYIQCLQYGLEICTRL